MEPSIIFDKVSKKFSKGYLSDSLRDAFTASIKGLFRRNGNEGKTAEKNEFWALKNISFEVKPGEALGIIGANGSGKSTALKLLSRIMRPDEGQITVKGRFGSLIELGAGFHFDLTGRENVFLNASILGMDRDEIEKRYDSIVDFAELHDFMETPVKWYSSGMQARLGFSVAAHIEPEVLIVDEVLSVGDVGFQRKCYDKMLEFKSNGTTIVFVSHNLKAVSTLCDRVVVLNKGVKEYEGSTDKAITYYFRGFQNLRESPDSGIQLMQATVRTTDGREANAFSSGDKAYVEMAYKFLKEYSDLYITIGILGPDLSLLTWVDSISLSGKNLKVSVDDKFTFPVELSLNLNPGNYEFITTVYDRVHHHRVYRRTFCPFVIQEHFAAGKGLVYIAPHLLEQDT